MQENMALARELAQRVADAGGRAYYVGGCVRDALMGRASEDTDIEVHGIQPDTLRGILDQMGGCQSFGKSFGVYALRGAHMDIAMPRRERATGRGHRDFEVDVDPNIGLRGAARRRDFTINAMMQDVLTGEIADPYGGREDLARGVLRHVCDSSFPEDPLRVLRAAQFAARFDLTVDASTIALCRGIDLTTLSRERVMGELSKALLKAARPSVFFEVLRAMDKLTPWFGELAALIGVIQSPIYHAEGDAYVHTLRVLDAAAARRGEAQNPLGFMLGALCHDLGKAVTTRVGEDGAIHAYGHERAGVPIARKLLTRLTGEKKLIDYALNLVALHMQPNQLARQRSGVKATNRMFDRAMDARALVAMALCDTQGRITHAPEQDAEPYLRERLGIYEALAREPQVAGADLIAAGLAPDKRFSGYLAYAHKLHLEGIARDEALRRTLAYARDGGVKS